MKKHANDGWRWKIIPNVSESEHDEFGSNFDDSTWKNADVKSDNGQLKANEQAIFRTNISINEDDLSARSVELNFGCLDDDAYVYVNGKRVGVSHNWAVPAAFDIKPLLHPGKNSIAVGVVNRAGAGGISKGVSMQFSDPPIVPEWKRSLFSGLAQIIVQSTREPGEITLIAKSPGLSDGVLKIQAKPAPPRLNVP